ncbi:MAG: hypothetical protein N0E48_20875, partial [Candidatus Thiodiazotropha endolucinida]|nr:hypothetical protein [Candidatus Thiodiazotropha endolucinida]
MNQQKGASDRRKDFKINLHERMLPNPRPPDHQCDAHPTSFIHAQVFRAKPKENTRWVPLSSGGGWLASFSPNIFYIWAKYWGGGRNPCRLY